MKNKISEGKNIVITATETIASGDVVTLGNIIGIAVSDADSGQEVVLQLQGIFALPKQSGLALEAGQRVYWNGTQATGLNNGVFIGHCLVAATINEQRVVVRLAASGYAPQSTSIIVASLLDLPLPVEGVITLEDDTAYYMTGTIDLEGSRLVGGSNTAILGSSSETSWLTSTGLPDNTPLLTTAYTTPIRDISFIDVHTALLINGTANQAALDWTGVNFVNVPNIGTLNGCSNFIFTKGAFINSKGFVITGQSDTIAFNNSLFSGGASAGVVISVNSSAIITRRFRLIYSSFVCEAGVTGINFDAAATVPNESYILDVVNFSGAGTYLSGVAETSNKALFERCKGIVNTAVNGQAYMRGNATATPIANTTNFYKVLGTTLPSSDNSKYLHSNNRLTNDAVIEREFYIAATVSFNSGNNHECEFGFFDSKLGAIRQPSIARTTANASGRAESVTLSCVVQHGQGNYIEVHCRNRTGTTNITVTEMNLIIIQL